MGSVRHRTRRGRDLWRYRELYVIGAAWAACPAFP